MKPTGISARNTRATSRMLVTSSRLRRLNTVERMEGALVPEFIGSAMVPRLAGTLPQGTAIPDRADDAPPARALRKLASGGRHPYVNRSADPRKERGRVRRVGACVAPCARKRTVAGVRRHA